MRGPEERVFEQQRVGFGFLQPDEGLLRMVFRIVVVAESEGGALSPDAGIIFVGEGGELFVGAGCAAMEVARQQGKFFLRGGVFGGGRIERGRSRVWFATGGAGGRFRMSSFFLFLFGLGGEIAGADERQTKNENGKNCGAGSRGNGEFCGVAAEILRPEGPSAMAEKISAIFRRWRRDIRRGRWNRRRQEFPPSSDKSNPPGGP